MTKLYTLEHVFCLVSKLCRESRLLVSNFMSRITLFWSHILTPKKLDCATKPTFVRSEVYDEKQYKVNEVILGKSNKIGDIEKFGQNSVWAIWVILKDLDEISRIG